MTARYPTYDDGVGYSGWYYSPSTPGQLHMRTGLDVAGRRDIPSDWYYVGQGANYPSAGTGQEAWRQWQQGGMGLHGMGDWDWTNQWWYTDPRAAAAMSLPGATNVQGSPGGYLPVPEWASQFNIGGDDRRGFWNFARDLDPGTLRQYAADYIPIKDAEGQQNQILQDAAANIPRQGPGGEPPPYVQTLQDRYNEYSDPNSPVAQAIANYAPNAQRAAALQTARARENAVNAYLGQAAGRFRGPGATAGWTPKIQMDTGFRAATDRMLANEAISRSDIALKQAHEQSINQLAGALASAQQGAAGLDTSAGIAQAQILAGQTITAMPMGDVMTLQQVAQIFESEEQGNQFLEDIMGFAQDWYTRNTEMAQSEQDRMEADDQWNKFMDGLSILVSLFSIGPNAALRTFGLI